MIKKIIKKIITVLTAASLILCGCRFGAERDGHHHEGHAHDECVEHHHGEMEECSGHSHEGHHHEADECVEHHHGTEEADVHKGHRHGEDAHEGHAHGGHDGHGEEAHSDGETVISTALQQSYGILTETVRPIPFQEILHTSGQISTSTDDETVLTAKISGVVSFGKLSEGTPVRQGGTLFTISTKGLESGDIVAKAEIIYETARKEYERDLKLSEENIVSESHLDQSRLAYEQAKAAYEALTSGGDGKDGVSVQSPITGHIKNLKVSNGDYVQTGQALATVSRNRRLRLSADLPQRHYSLAAGISDANFTTSGSGRVYSIRELNGRLLSYGRTSGTDYYIPVIFEFDNVGDIVPGSFADVRLKVSTRSESLTVPQEAILEEEGSHYIFVRTEPETFCKRIVKLGQGDGRRVRVISGLEEGEEIVSSGAVQVKLAAFKAVPAGHSHSH